jgi:CheY-like chemotaxis protein
VGIGSVFWVELAEADAPELVFGASGLADGDDGWPAPAPASSSAPRRTLLYIEDNPANMALVDKLVSRRPDLSLITAVEAQRGLLLARSHRPHVILMDINLPGLSGYGALALLRQDPATAHIPVLALSANAVPRDIERGLLAGFFRYLTKPIQVDEFMAALDQALRRADEQAPPTAEAIPETTE